MQIVLYNSTQDKRTVNKTLTTVGTVDGALYDSVGSKQIDLLIQQSQLPNFNYVYVSSTGRYYFVDTIEYTHKGFKVSCTVDVLMTYREQIKQLQATLIYGTGNDYYSGNDTEYDIRPSVTKYEYPQQPLKATGSIVMITIKGSV